MTLYTDYRKRIFPFFQWTISNSNVFNISNIFGNSGVYQITYKSLSEYEQLTGNVEWLYKQGNFSHTKHLNEIIKILFFTQFKSYY